MSIDKDLMEILACPSCRGPVEEHEDEQVIVCTKCGLRYPIRDGIPIMLIDEAEKPAAGKSKKKK